MKRSRTCGQSLRNILKIALSATTQVACCFCRGNMRKRSGSSNPVLAIDPEDVQAHYNLMLCYNGLGDRDRAEEHQARYLRFKADESAQAITGNYRITHPEDNNERQSIHEHTSVVLK